MVVLVYEATRRFPRQELFGLTAQMRRAAISVPSNIAEGFRRRSRWDKARFINIAAASLEELRYQLLLSKALGFLPSDSQLERRAEEVSKMLSSYERAIVASAAVGAVRTFLLTSVFCLLYSF